MPPALFTGVHIDRVYMGRGSQRMLTEWIPIGACLDLCRSERVCTLNENVTGILIERMGEYRGMVFL